MNDAQRIDHRVRDEIHDCIRPTCDKRAKTAFIAREHGRFAGRDMKPGDWIDLCADDAADVYRAQHQTRDQLPDWLRVDAKPDPYDTLFDLSEGP
ncbi:hypothetical protein [Nonomuraea guangzhouensis]|uniref:Uncharacterized protein n=1 Tax=Nonomuraea guangzhouensis TaxID=1291555 RepID=A0ABW4GXU6_9ACTN|nr:hypothetical protein [Nonomuraea guangzhouensis]